MRGTPREVLKEVWGYESFRPMQEEVIRSVLSGADTLALMPTGGGKSITFQVPALMMPGICIVITPLVALMKDQVASLRAKDLKAEYLYAGQTRRQVMTILDNCMYGEYKFLYVSPERLQNETFLMRLKDLQVSLLVVDESHCICQWGYDFRPSYLRISHFRELLPECPCLALTATATREVVRDIRDKLSFSPSSHTFKRSFYRPSLSYVVRDTSDKPREMIHILKSVEGSALVYVRSRDKTKRISDLLMRYGISSDYYHAGLSERSKGKKQKAWQEGITRVMVCTNAFGMGIDKEDVRLVIHPELPPDPEGYYQEAGRAGRDNKRAYAVLLFDPEMDPGIMYKRLAHSYPPREMVGRIYEAMCNYFQLALGTGEGALFEMNIPLFAMRFRFSYFSVTSALHILSLAGYIDYMEDKSFSSRIKFLVGRNELYDLFDSSQKIYDDVVEVILRNYTGVFTDHVFMDEEVIGQRLGMPAQQLYQILLDLARWHIVDYIPGKKSNFVRFLQVRLPKEKIMLKDDIYKLRFKAEKQRLEVMLSYAEESERCRVERLMEYFGEEQPKPCGWCDYCLAHPTAALTYREVDALSQVLQGLNERGKSRISQESLSGITGMNREKIEEALAFMGREGYRYRIEGSIIIMEQ